MESHKRTKFAAYVKTTHKI